MAELLPMDIDQGEDFAADLVWTDMFDEPVQVVHPCRMEIKGFSGQTFVTLESNPELPEGEVPSINLSSEIGLIQLYIPASITQALLPSEYTYDLFVSTGSATDFAGVQRKRLVYGPVIVNKRTTQM